MGSKGIGWVIFVMHGRKRRGEDRDMIPPDHISELLLSTAESPDTLQRKLSSAACIRDLSQLVTKGEGQQTHRPVKRVSCFGSTFSSQQTGTESTSLEMLHWSTC